MNFPHPPENSIFVIDHDEIGRPRLTIPACPRLSRWVPAAFIAFWLCGWAMGEFMVGSILVGVFRGVQQQAWFVTIFLLGWLGAWTIGGGMAALSLYTLVLGGKAERITFDDSSLLHQPGWDLGPVSANSDWSKVMWQAKPWLRARTRTIPKMELSEIRLERIGEQQRLTVDYGADRVELGQTLREPEREWLLLVLQAWTNR